MTKPPLFNRSLWQVAQYCLTSAVCDSLIDVGACATAIAGVVAGDCVTGACRAEARSSCWRAEADRPRPNTSAERTTNESLFIRRLAPDQFFVERGRQARPFCNTNNPNYQRLSGILVSAFVTLIEFGAGTNFNVRVQISGVKWQVSIT